jgi:ABC-2 type transport system ATP-binding protein
LLTVNNLTKSYGRQRALSNIGINVQAGGIVGLLGPNGSGKTTLIKIIMGLITDYAGTVSINGNPPGVEACSRVSYLPDRIVMPSWLTVREAVGMYKDFYADFDRERAEAMLSDMGISQKKKIKALSKGMTEKLQLSLTMSRRAKLYVLDEPIAAVDPAARDFIIRTIIGNYAEDSLVLVSTHLIGDIEPILDRVLFLREGEIILDEGTEEIRQREGKSIDQLFREVFKC